MKKPLFLLILLLTLHPFSAFAQASCDAGADHIAQAESAYGQRDYAGAAAAYSCAIEANPDSAAAYNGRGNAQRHLRQYSAAIADYTSAIEIDDTAAIYYNNRGWTQFLLGNYTEALNDLNHALELDPDLAFAYNNRGQVYAAQGQYDLAEADYNQAIALNHNPLSWPQYNLSLLPQYASANPPTETPTPTMPPPVEGTPTEIPADPNVDYVALARAAYRAGNYEEAAAAYTSAIRVDSRNDVLYFERGKTYYMMGIYRQALHDFEEAIDLRRTAEYFTWRGSSYAAVNDTTRAIPDFDMAITLDTLYLNAYIYRAMNYVSAGNATQALANMQLWQSLAQSYITDQALPAPGETVSLDFSGQRIYRVIFEAQSGQTLSVETLAPEDSETDTFLVLVGPDDLPITADHDSGIGLNAALTNYRLSESGGYTVYISYTGADGIVEFSLELGN